VIFREGGVKERSPSQSVEEGWGIVTVSGQCQYPCHPTTPHSTVATLSLLSVSEDSCNHLHSRHCCDTVITHPSAVIVGHPRQGDQSGR
jgi:hypothetical protein